MAAWDDQVLVYEDSIQNIADAIREKNGETRKYYPSEMAEAIEDIEGVDEIEEYLNSTISKVIDSEGTVEVIERSAFYCCYSLSQVSFPACTTIGSSAFYRCSSLSQISFPACTTISGSVFAYCSSLSQVGFPACTTIGSSAFTGCSSLSQISFPACTSIGSAAFYSCSSLSAAYFLASSVATLGNLSVFLGTPMSLSSFLGYYGSIYVPESLLASYKTATNWSLYSDRLVGV